MRAALFCGAAAICAIGSVSAAAQEAITTPILTSVDNFRDVAGIAAEHGGTGYANTVANDGVMRTGVFYRSNALTLSAQDAATVAPLGITHVYDLRTAGEIHETPDVLPTGAMYKNIDILGDGNDQMSFLANVRTPAQAVAAMEQLNRTFVTSAVSREGFRELLLDLAQTPGALLFHCTSGKDRTGWAAAILQTIAGTSQETIMQDYLATNSYSDTQARLAGLPAQAAAIYGPLLGVQASYLQAAFDQVEESYGSMQNYLIQGLGLTQEDIYVLRARMVYYRSLPGQANLAGNALQGALLLGGLQDSELSGTYSDYNYWLQSAIDAGTLGGLDARVGGQLHADTLSTLLREPQRIRAALEPYASGQGMEDGQTAIWQINLADAQRTRGSAIAARATSSNMGMLLGFTHRFNSNAAAYIAGGHNWGQVRNNGLDAHTSVNSFIASAGIRYGFTGLEEGPYLALSGTAQTVKYRSTRVLNEQLGTATGRSDGHVLSANLRAGTTFNAGRLGIQPQVGANISKARLDAFAESGSDLALTVDKASRSQSSLEAMLKLKLRSSGTKAWAIEPAAEFGYVRMLSTPASVVHASVYGVDVTQTSAFNSRNTGVGRLDIQATRGPVRVSAGVNGQLGDNRRTSSYGGQVAFNYTF